MNSINENFILRVKRHLGIFDSIQRLGQAQKVFRVKANLRKNRKCFPSFPLTKFLHVAILINLELLLVNIIKRGM